MSGSEGCGCGGRCSDEVTANDSSSDDEEEDDEDYVVRMPAAETDRDAVSRVPTRPPWPPDGPSEQPDGDGHLGIGPIVPPQPPRTPRYAIEAQPPPPPEPIGDLVAYNPNAPPDPDPPAPPHSIDDFKLDCQIVQPPPPELNPNLGDLPGDLAGTVGWESSGNNPSSALAAAAAATVATADDLRTSAPPPVCPPRYHFRYDYQACFSNYHPPVRNAPADQLHKYACVCDKNHSFVVGGPKDGDCWKWGTPEVAVGDLPKPGEFSGGEQHCPPGYVWDSRQQRCVDDLVCFPSSAFRQPSPKFRAKVKGRAKCVGSDLDVVSLVFFEAYQRCRAAELELDYLATLDPGMMAYYWGRFDHLPESALSYWFGDNLWLPTPIPEIPGTATTFDVFGRFAFVRRVVRAVGHAFRNGFRNNNKGVRIRCKSRGCAGGAGARHLKRNTITICPPFFGFEREVQIYALLHEMHHWSVKPLAPRDRNNPLCESDDAGSNCYQFRLTGDGGDTDDATSLLFYTGGPPRRLVEAFEDGDFGAGADMIYNIDNFTSWILNRWVDRGPCRLDEPSW